MVGTTTYLLHIRRMRYNYTYIYSRSYGGIIFITFMQYRKYMIDGKGRYMNLTSIQFHTQKKNRRVAVLVSYPIHMYVDVCVPWMNIVPLILLHALCTRTKIEWKLESEEENGYFTWTKNVYIIFSFDG